MKTKVKFLASAVGVLLLMACGNSQKDASNNGNTEANGLANSDGTAGNYYSRDPGTNDKLLDNSTPYETNKHSGVNTDNTMSQQDPNRSQQQNPNASQQQNPSTSQGDYDTQRNQQIYSSLKMTDDQIQKYENAWRSSMDTWKRDNPNKTMSAQHKVRAQNDNLKSVLDDTQYQNYEKWSTANPYRN